MLTCLRRTGSAAVQRTGHAGFFALHDLMHYAVETTMAWRKAFFGLVEEGWDFSTFEDHGDPRYRALPAEALWAEHLVAAMTRRVVEGHWNDPELLSLFTEDLNRELAATLGATVVNVSPSQALRIYTRFVELERRWSRVMIGEHLELTYPS